LNTAVKLLLQNNAQIWRANEPDRHIQKGHSTGFDDLDDILPLSGWPPHGLVEVILPRWGVGELQLLLPLLVAMSQKAKRISWIAPPYIPYAPALVEAGIDLTRLVVLPKRIVKNEALWAMEKILSNPGSGVALCWPGKINDKAMRRLQLAAVEGNSLGFIFRDHSVAASPAPLRIAVEIVRDQIKVSLLKARGATRLRHVCLNLPVLAQ